MIGPVRHRFYSVCPNMGLTTRPGGFHSSLSLRFLVSAPPGRVIKFFCHLPAAQGAGGWQPQAEKEPAHDYLGSSGQVP